MSEYEVRPISEMPKRSRLGKQTFADTIRGLPPDQAIFVPNTRDESLTQQCRRLGGSLCRYKAHIRQDPERNGVWIYKDGAT